MNRDVFRGAFCLSYLVVAMFKKEAEMTGLASDWLRAGGMLIKAEFVTPWGICDLVGLRYNPKMVDHRVRLKQTRAIGSLMRASLLLKIPDIETGEWTTMERLSSQPEWASMERLLVEAERLIADRFVVRSEGGRLQRLNGWMPLHDRLIAVELKRSRIEEAMQQALSNFGFAEESYVGLPADVAARVAAKPERWARYFDEGVGLLAIAEDGCRALLPSRRNPRWASPALQAYCVDKFWSMHVKGK